MLVNVAIGLTLVLAGLALLNLFVSEKQRTQLGHRILRFWTWLDDVKQISLLHGLRGQNAHQWIVGIAVVLACGFVGWIVWPHHPEYAPKTLQSWIVFGIFILVPVALSVWFGLNVIYWTLNATSLVLSFLRVTLFVVLALLPFFAVIGFILHFRELLTPRGTVTLLQAVTINVLATTALFTGVVLIFWVVVFIPMLIVYTITSCLYLGEFVVRRIAEYPAGPILALSAILFAILSLIKLFT